MPRRKKPVKRVREADLENKHCAELNAEGWKTWKQSGLGRAGRPDRHLMGPRGENGHIEWKKPGEVPTPLQADELDQLEMMYHSVAACDSLESARKFVNAVDYSTPETTWLKYGWRQRWKIEHPDGASLPKMIKRGFKRG
jgi:hypothetical protein